MSDQPSDIVQMNDLDDFVQHLVAWHNNRVAQLNQLLNAPEEVEIRFSQDEGKDLVLTGENRKGFMAGLVVAKDLLGTLPFTLSLEDPVEEEQVDE